MRSTIVYGIIRVFHDKSTNPVALSKEFRTSIRKKLKNPWPRS
ncbi:hypothetical protein BN2497_7807 [Janthinobacterium sp. CG23_2]|nr:hypothetical protein BN2497_7807 [Janthinobacterium sp. CG23_2]CUU30301.1 hypothetical protein BN3177_7807 [Janthinobacterium sp. CG23_2]